MSTINDKLIRLASYKDEIKAAIIAKGQTVGDNMSLYAEAISKISGGDEPGTGGLVTEQDAPKTYTKD